MGRAGFVAGWVVNAPARITTPFEDEFSAAARDELAQIRDRAARGAHNATDSAAVFLVEIARLATFAVVAHRPASDLIRISSALKFAMEAARHIDRVTRDG